MSDAARFKEAIDKLNKVREDTGLDRNGKKYSMVKDRVEQFRIVFGSEFGIDTNVDYHHMLTNNLVVCCAKIVDRNGQILASGHAMEFYGSNEITRTSVIEAVETNAIGRALAAFGFHGGEYASGNEMEKVRERPAVHGAGMEAKSSVINGADNGAYGAHTGSGLYIPGDDQSVWNQPHPHADMVLKNIDNAVDMRQLTMYWSELKPFRTMLQTQNAERLNEVRAAFATRRAQVEMGHSR